MASLRPFRSALYVLSFSILSCSQQPDKNDTGSLKVKRDTIYIYRSEAAAAPYIDDFERVHIDSVEARRQITKIRHSPETRLLGDIDTAVTVMAKQLFIRLYVRQAGQLEIEDTHGVYQNVMISVSDYGEYETNQVFAIGPFLAPKFKNSGKDLGDHYVIEVNHGYNSDKNTRFAIYMDKVVEL